MDIETLRMTYPKFIYHSYEINNEEDKIVLKFDFEIENLKRFNPTTTILKKDFDIKNIDSNRAKKIVFFMGMVEAISYYKAVCSPKFVIECGRLDKEQEEFYLNLLYYGLGEFRYRNEIDIKKENFVQFISEGEELVSDYSDEIKRENKGLIIPVGGGKDSVVTMELLKKYKDDTLCMSIGAKDVVVDCIEAAGFDRTQLIEVKRVIDKNLIELNNEGYLNGHTPFSAILAFINYYVAFVLGKKYIALSNEDSANESNVAGEKINHQYSKTYEFENNFRNFVKKNIECDIEYFSFLRPIKEIQIAMLFSRFKKYHKVFKSCNVGSKSTPWVWCCNCPKCLFVYTILSPFIEREEMVSIFGEDLFERKDLEKTFIELCGFGDIKPFECVGTYEEVQYAVVKAINNYKKMGMDLPYLLKIYEERYNMNVIEYAKFYNEENFLPKEFDEILRNSILNS